MNKLLRFATTASVLGIAGMVTSTPAQANPPLTEVERLGNQIHRLTGREPMSQVTAISQLSDVRPTDWAFTALQSLVERYNCIAGYPDRTYRGNRAMTRYEFAAGLNACLDKINEIIASGLADKVSKDDLDAIQKLQEEFAAELATLRGRVDTLEGKVATLEAQQFSTTTKLEGQAIFAISGATAQNTVFVGRSRLNLNTSFTGNDLLQTRLDSGNNPAAPANTPFLDYSTAVPGVTLTTLRYDFKIGKDFSVSVGPVMNAFDLLDTNSYANNEAVDFSNTFFLNNQLLLPVAAGGGIFAKYNPNQGPFYISALYYGGNASEAAPGIVNPTGGLFGENNQLTVELGYVPTDKEGNIPFALKLQYTRATLDGATGYSSLIAVPSTLDAFGANLEWAFARGAALFGRFGIGTVRGNVAPNPSVTPIYWTVGFAFPNLFKKGALAGIGVGQPEANLATPATQTNLEIFYNYPLSDNIRITPDIQFIFSPDNLPAPTVFVGTLRTVFSF
jgi:hypothetical protein